MCAKRVERLSAVDAEEHSVLAAGARAHETRLHPAGELGLKGGERRCWVRDAGFRVGGGFEGRESDHRNVSNDEVLDLNGFN